MSMDKIIAALDYNSGDEALKLVDLLGGKISFYKVGSVLFTTEGPQMIRELKKRGKKVFLDLKYHDIPNTVKHAVESAIKLEVDMITLHTLGGYVMMKEAVSAVKNQDEYKPILLGVTVLTSMREGDLDNIGINRSVEKQVKKLAKAAKNAGIKGIVCSSHEIETIKHVYKDDELTLVIPGIRPTFAQKGDQKRVATPSEAFKLGADYLVVGRPITQALDPLEAVEKLESELCAV
ncbi:orotidine-5'-phosphate decarboxylase [bacterium]